MDGLDTLETLQKFLGVNSPGESVKVRLDGGDKFSLWLWTENGHAISSRGDLAKRYPGTLGFVPANPAPGDMVRYGTDDDLAAIQCWVEMEVESMKTIELTTKQLEPYVV